MTLDAQSGLMSGYRVVQSLPESQHANALLEASDGTLFTGSGWCGPTPPYFSKDGGETWQPADRGVHPPNSSYCLAEYKGQVYIGTGYEPWHGQVYRWLGDSGPDYWELVQDIAPPRSIVTSLAVVNDALFVGSAIYGWNGEGYETSTPVYRLSSVGYGEGGGAWCEGGGVLSNCVVIGNRASGSGGGVFGGAIRNSLICGNQAEKGGGVFSCSVYDCTLSGNSADIGGGAWGEHVVQLDNSNEIGRSWRWGA